MKESLGGRIGRLRRYAETGALMPAGRLLGLPELPPGEVWLDIAGASVVTGNPPHTITGWLNREGPQYAPFPAAAQLLYQLYWPLSEIAEWHAGTAWLRGKTGTPIHVMPCSCTRSSTPPS